jgi:hypothetical protein
VRPGCVGELVEGCGAAGGGERGASASAGVSSSSSVSMLSFSSVAGPVWSSRWEYRSGGWSLASGVDAADA